MKNNDEFFIKIGDPSTLRRNLLESSKILLGCMQSYERVRQIRAKKHMYLEQLRTMLKNNATLVAKFKKKLPKEAMHKLRKKYDHYFVSETPGFHSHATLPSETEIEALDRELTAIEQKLMEF